MQEIRYSRKRLWIAAAGCLFATVMSVWTILFSIIFLISSILLIVRALGNPAAVSWDDKGVRVRGFFGQRFISWANLDSVSVRKTTMRLYGIIPIAYHTYLDFKPVNARLGLGTRSVWFLYLQNSAADAPMLVDTILRARAQHMAGIAGAAQRASMLSPDNRLDGAPRSDTVFDPDAIIARHLAARNAAPARASLNNLPLMPGAPPRRTFGRK